MRSWVLVLSCFWLQVHHCVTYICCWGQTSGRGLSTSDQVWDKVWWPENCPDGGKGSWRLKNTWADPPDYGTIKINTFIFFTAACWCIQGLWESPALFELQPNKLYPVLDSHPVFGFSLKHFLCLHIKAFISYTMTLNYFYAHSVALITLFNYSLL